MSRLFGTISRGVRAPIIKEGDDIVKIVTDSVLEASKVEGATKWEEFWFITFPMLSRITLLVGVFTMVELFINERNPLIAEVYKKVKAAQYDESSAMIWFYFIIVAAVMGIIMFLFNKFILKRYEA